MTKRDDETAGFDPQFDPRFDPAFQPGYRPEAAEPSRFEALRAAVTRQPARATSTLHSDSPSDAENDAPAAGRHDLGVDPRERTTGADGANSADGADGNRADGRVGAGAIAPDDTVDATPDPAYAPPRRNPFVLVLWALSALITLGGIGMVRWSFTLTEELQTSNMASQADYQLSYMMQQSGPLFVALGLGVAAMTVFLHAQAWNRRRS